jgi:hypothetical protein
LNRGELIALVIKIQSCEGSEHEIDNLIELFSDSLNDPRAVDYIFQLEYKGLSAEEIIDKVLSYKRIRV